MTPRKNTNWIVVHCSATRPVQDIGVKEIRQWHKAKGWQDIGYHFVIRRDGRIEKGRPANVIGSHVAGHNADSVGVCMVGGLADKAPWAPAASYTPAQWKALEGLLKTLVKAYPKAKVRGHRDFPKVAKACPCFDAIPWAKGKGLPAG